MRYKSKYVEIDAIQWTGNNTAEISKFTENGFNAYNIESDSQAEPVVKWAEVYDYLQQTWVPANLNDYIIKGTEDEFYPCAETVFNRKYELKTDEDANELGLYEGDTNK